MNQLEFLENYHVPRVCKECGGVMIYDGVGEYHCEECNFLDFDDYGKVRGYIEKHRGATAAEIENAVGVSQRVIRKLLRDGRIEIAENSKVYLECENCGKKIRSGMYCPECETQIHRKLEAKQRAMLHKDAHGFGAGKKGDEGHKRFVRHQ